MSRIAWSLRVRSKEHELVSSYWVTFFLGAIPDDWRDDNIATMIGTHASYTYSMMHVPLEDDESITGIIYLENSRLKRNLGVSTAEELTHDVVVSYLRQNVHWRIENGRDVFQDKDLSSLEVEVLSMTDEQNRANECTTYPLYPLSY